jgi:hypothetical protein
VNFVLFLKFRVRSVAPGGSLSASFERPRSVKFSLSLKFRVSSVVPGASLSAS